ncbi:hypothetical protein F5X68DRAFT_191278 [Plectosphaerella plurivora]|uniref:Uncharacterized protein n=1 Tax=Plectosphaerella plurivora TaxID=936078 RepID=A0A9P9ABX9_9PEZI|nr:hypothetical protein F5X68DRAFT_191278 [Plectosphaerella plurivora]
MAPSGNTPKGNFKTYEGQARLLRAIIAAHPDVKWDHKKIQQAHGSDMSIYSLEHRMKDIKAQVKLLNSAIKAGVDCVEIPVELPKTEKLIAKMYGASTTEGIAWQFRGLKKDAEALRTAANKGEKAELNLTTPKSRGGAGTKRAATQPRSSAKRKKTAQSEEKIVDDNEDDDDFDFDAMDDTPSKSRVKKEESDTPRPRLFGTPSRGATSAAAAAIKNQAIDLTSEDEAITPPGFDDEPIPIKDEFESIFGPGAQIHRPVVDKTAPAPVQSQPSSTGNDYDFAEFLQAMPAQPMKTDDYLDGEI